MKFDANRFSALPEYTLAAEIARLERDRASWRQMANAAVDMACQTQSCESIARSLSSQMEYSLGLAAKTKRQQHHLNVAGLSGSTVGDALQAMEDAERLHRAQLAKLLDPLAEVRLSQRWNALEEAERAQREQMRKLLDPMDDIRRMILAQEDDVAKLARTFSADTSVFGALRAALDFAGGTANASDSLARQAGNSVGAAAILADSLASISVQKYLKDFEATNKRWMVPNE